MCIGLIDFCRRLVLSRQKLFMMSSKNDDVISWSSKLHKDVKENFKSNSTPLIEQKLVEYNLNFVFSYKTKTELFSHAVQVALTDFLRSYSAQN